MTKRDRLPERTSIQDDAEPSNEPVPNQVSLNPDTDESELIHLTVEARAHGWRLDHYLNRLFGNHSRAQLQKAIETGRVTLNGVETKPSRRLRVNDRLNVDLHAAKENHIRPENIPLDILFEDDALVVVNKPANMVVHPGRGSYSGTLTAALQFHFDQLSDVGGRHRPGIVHRLDRDTTGVIVVAKDNQVHNRISKQFEDRQTKKEYLAIVRGVPELQSDLIKTHVAVHSRVREKMMVCAPGGRSREAVTFFKTAERFKRFALTELHPLTGRTHQLRVHMQHIGTPIVADKLYIGEDRFTVGHLTGRPMQGKVLMERQALHAFRLTITHPHTGKEITFEAPLPADFACALTALREDLAS